MTWIECDSGITLDIAIGEKVFNYKVIASEKPRYIAVHPEKDLDKFYAESVRLPRYSGYIRDAWLVIEKIVEMGWAFSIKNMGRSWSCWIAEVDRSGLVVVDGRYGYANGDTAPEVICNAAMKAFSA